MSGYNWVLKNHAELLNSHENWVALDCPGWQRPWHWFIPSVRPTHYFRPLIERLHPPGRVFTSLAPSWTSGEHGWARGSAQAPGKNITDAEPNVRKWACPFLLFMIKSWQYHLESWLQTSCNYFPFIELLGCPQLFGIINPTMITVSVPALFCT